MDIEITREDVTGVNITDNETMVDLYAISPVRDILIGTFVPVFVVSFTGNLLVIYVIVRNRSMHTVTNFFLLNLALSDLLVTVCCILPTLMWFIQVSWTLGVFVCKAHKATITMTTTASVFMLTVISMERFIAILYPFRTKQILTVQRLIGVVIAIWMLSILISSPVFVFYELVPYLGGVYCGATSHFINNIARIHGCLMVVVCYVAPLLIMVVLYTQIGQGLWARSRMGSNPLPTLRHESSGGGGGASSSSSSNEKTKSSLKVTYKGNKAVSSVGDSRQANSSPHKEGLRIHIGRQISPPPGESTSRENENATGSTSLCQVNASKTRSGETDLPDMIGPFFVDEPNGTENVMDPESRNTAVFWKSGSERLGEGDDQTEGSTAGIDTEQVEIDYNGVGNRAVISRTESAPNAQSTRAHGKQALRATDSASSTASRTQLGSIPEGDKKALRRKYERLSIGSQGSPPSAYARGSNARSLPRQYFKKLPSKTKRNAAAVMAARRKVVRLLVVMVVCFAACLFPLQLVFFWSLFGGFRDDTVKGALLTAFTYLAYFLNSALNPFLYAFLSDNFRSKMRETLHCGSSRTRRQASLRQMKLRSMTSDAVTESELMPS